MEQKIKNALAAANLNDNWSDLLDLMDENIEFSATIPEGTPISGIFRGKESVINYFTHTLPSVASFHQNVETEYAVQDNKIIVLGDDTYHVIKNDRSYRSPYAMVIRFTDEKITKILIIQDLSGIYLAYI